MRLMRRVAACWPALTAAIFAAAVLSLAEEAPATAKPVKDSVENNAGLLTEEERASVQASQETHQYQAEVTRLMDIIINSLYTQREVFLRELISNSVDALEKARFLAISDKAVLQDKPELEIKVEFNEPAKTVSLCDSGIGMSKDDLINNLGTVAKSGTSNFLEALAQGNDVNLIGQFGVGFYSAFLVADRVTVVSKTRGDEQYIWESSADATYYVAKDPRGDTLGRGTCVILHLKEDATEFLNESRLRDLVHRYSQFMSYPIYIKTVKTITEEVPDETQEPEPEKEGEEKDDVEVKDADEEQKKEKPSTKTVEKKVSEWEQVNKQKAIWLRSKDDITEAEYTEFYKAVSKDWSDPLLHMHFSAEGEVEFKALLYIPARSPSDIFNNYFGKQTSIKLYVRRVLVADSFDDLLPKYLHFVRGVIDSDDLPLNVSREQLQQQKIISLISKKIVKKTLETIRKLYLESEKTKEEIEQKLKEESDSEKIAELKKQQSAPTQFSKFYSEFSRNLTLGCYEDDANRSKIAKVLQFASSMSPDTPRGLEKYIQNMGEGQTTIYYAAGESKEQIMSLPQMQIFKKKGIEVLFLLESMDESCVQRLMEFEGKKFESIQKGDITLEETEDEKKLYKRTKKYFAPLLKWWKARLGDKVTKVEVSKRLVDAPCAVVASQWGYSAQMEKIMKTQTFTDPMHMRMMLGQKVFEINPHHKIVQYLLNKTLSDEKPSEKDGEIADRLYSAAMLASGFDVDKPGDLASVLYKSLAEGVGVDPDEPIMSELPLPEETEESAKGEPDDSADSDDFSDLDDDALKNLDLGSLGMEKDEL